MEKRKILEILYRIAYAQFGQELISMEVSDEKDEKHTA